MINTMQAIFQLYPNVVRVSGDTAYDIDGDEVVYDLSAVTEQAQKDECKAKAKDLLSQSDWSVLPDVGLKNVNDFIAYRGILRGLIIQPQINPDFPVAPNPIWQ